MVALTLRHWFDAARGKACAADAECADLDGGACIQGVCSCKDDYVPAVASNKCLSGESLLTGVGREGVRGHPHATLGDFFDTPSFFITRLS